MNKKGKLHQQINSTWANKNKMKSQNNISSPPNTNPVVMAPNEKWHGWTYEEFNRMVIIMAKQFKEDKETVKQDTEMELELLYKTQTEMMLEVKNSDR